MLNNYRPIDDLEGSLVQLTSKFVCIIAIVPEFQTAEKLVVLIVVPLSTPTPLLDYGVVVYWFFHVTCTSRMRL
jgi:hypothetical protein